MTASAAELDLGTLDSAVDAAIARGIPAGLPIVGFREITLVIGADEVDEVLERLVAAIATMSPGNAHGT